MAAVRTGTALLSCAAAAALLAPAAAHAEGARPHGDPGRPDPDSLAASVTAIDPAAFVAGIDPADSVEELEMEENEGGTTTLTLSADVLFAFDEAELTDTARGTIADAAADLSGVTGTVQVTGHSDGIGDDAYNRTLSQERAEAVGAVLEEELGADGPEIETEGVGADEPLAEETGSEGEDLPAARAQNRRVEISYGA